MFGNRHVREIVVLLATEFDAVALAGTAL